MKKNILIVTLLMASVASADQPSYKKKNNHTGTYAMDLGNGAGGMLKIIQGPDNKIFFDLDCSRGAPSYNTGSAQGTIKIKDKTALYRSTEFDGICEFKFTFRNDEVYVSQTGSDTDCGFGYGVSCDGKYYLKSRKQPKLSDQ
jgi:hypothetical protein